ncbi:TPA: site-specific DNA-methyltransferase [Escherichia coli]|uniref:site-specific DNA-methyltransferase n=1 Tax=Escherichia coli TaxID=562 RepID=UPI000BE5E27D|nr:site-specific DNA-methyltransferase [Escherichia coli]EEU3123283.1 site-specific DNA-methyltransferase [Escherichia coli]EEW2658098.1 site-specific DNA-methyltransferase [Escherichia coli]EFI3524714.1 site-specific DNA-methyltransferase [Escherichia coli]EFL3965835.1 site-specific DNA-methyltransferase [Escherichia coli]HAW5881330.1 site-specific DNA-methyltransferase [Escherichia coli]
MSKTKLELTWIGKDKRPKLEPRILLEDPDLSYHASHKVSESDCFDNKLIFGDNLLALKALEQEFTGKVKCVYIDPPFNTGEAFENYDDGLEHSIWLNLMYERAKYIYKLMSDDGTLFVHIDDNEIAYLTVILDEIFGRENRVSIVTFKQGSVTGHKAINPGLVTTTNFILVYAKNKKSWVPNRLFTAKGRDSRYSQFIENYEESYENWRYIPLSQAVGNELGIQSRQLKKALGENYEREIESFVMRYPERVIRTARPDYKSVGQNVRDAIDASKKDPEKVFLLKRENHSDMYFTNGERILFYKDKLKEIDGMLVAGEPLSNLWDDLLSNNLHKEGGIKFPKGKKPEFLIKRVLELCTQEGDLVLDSFAGSGTTAAVAHKLNRRWITIELGDHCHSHILPRLQQVIDGKDQDGVSKSVNWQGGGGFRYYKLAPSLIEYDRFGQPVINKEFNAEMLAEAVCKLEGFTYAPSDTLWWQHGYSTETDFIYVTTQNLSIEQLEQISEEVGSDKTLLVMCGAFRCKADRFTNLTIKKLPKAVLKHCEWAHDDYSLNVRNLPMTARDPAQDDLF